MQKKRRPFLSFLLSLFFPGLGQLYNGRPRRAAWFYLLAAALPLSLLLLPFTLTALVSWLAVVAAWRLYIAVEAALDSRRLGAPILTEWQRPLVYFGAAILMFSISAAATFGMKRRIEAFRIPSISMEPTLEAGDTFLVDKRGPYVPRRGDLVVFRREDEPDTPGDESLTAQVKRVVALPGETVEVRGTEVLVGGAVLTEPYAKWVEGGSKSFPPAQVPAGHVFLLGDNRDRSKDARYWPNPFLRVEQVLGRIRIVYWSKDRSRVGVRFD